MENKQKKGIVSTVLSKVDSFLDMKIKQKKVFALVTIFYVLNLLYTCVKYYLNQNYFPVAAAEFDLRKYVYLSYLSTCVFYLLIGVVLCSIYSCEKRDVLLEVLYIDVTGCLISFADFWCSELAQDMNTFILGQGGILIPPGALLAGVEIMRYYRMFKQKK